MALTSITMDPVVMAAVIISIGFSVDIPTHVSYHFHTALSRTSRKPQKCYIFFFL